MARKIVRALPEEDLARFKAIDLAPKLHQGMLTLRLYFRNTTAPDPDVVTLSRADIL